MKKLLLTLFTTGCCLCLCAQDSLITQTQIGQYIFSEFTHGIVKKKTGELINASLNYNTLSEEMIFESEKGRLALYPLTDIDTVWVGDKTFIPVGKVFYEKATATQVALYIQHKSDIIPPEKPIGYGNTIAVGSVSTLNDVRLREGNKAYQLKVPDNYKTTSRTRYFIKGNGSFKVLNNLKNLLQIFPGKSDAIKDFIRTNNTSFDKDEDMVKLITFCNA